MNRAERRKEKFNKGASKFKFGSKKPVDFSKFVDAIKQRQQTEPKDYLGDFIILEEVIQKLFNGIAEPEEFNFIAFRFNMAVHRCKEINPDLFETMRKINVDTMQVIAKRWHKWQKLQVTESEKEAILLGQNILEEVVKNSSRLQLNTAWKKGMVGAAQETDNSEGSK